MSVRSDPTTVAVLADVAAGAAQRERRDESPFAQVAAVAGSGLGALSLPVAQGGAGVSVRELLGFVVDLAEADPIVAHVLRTHYSHVLGLLGHPDPAVRARWLGEVRAGRIIGNAISESGPAAAGGHEFDTVLSGGIDGDGPLVLDGTKYYSTGTLYSDLIAVAARVEDDRVATVLVPADRDGVDVVDDWDGMGQSRTGTGTTSFRAVTVARDEVLSVRPRREPRPAGTVPFLQLYLHAVVAGILRSVVADATDLVRSRRRTFDHAPSPDAVDDPVLHGVVGGLAATAWVAETAVLAAADDVAAALAHDTPGLAHRASWSVSAVKVHLDRVALDAATALFDVGGASASSRARNLDRHWRNLRTLTLHNPAAYKATALGRHLVTGAALPANGYF